MCDEHVLYIPIHLPNSNKIRGNVIYVQSVVMAIWIVLHIHFDEFEFIKFFI